MRLLVIQSRITTNNKDKRQELIDEFKEHVKNDGFLMLPLGFDYSVVEVDGFIFGEEKDNGK